MERFNDEKAKELVAKAEEQFVAELEALKTNTEEKSSVVVEEKTTA